MGSTSRNPRIVHFGDCVLDLDTAELLRNGTKTSLQSQPFQILTALLENPGQLVTREQLTKKLWPDGTFVDFDQSLNKAVARLREALGDNAENPRYIETLSRRGYRWILPLRPDSLATKPRVLESLPNSETSTSTPEQFAISPKERISSRGFGVSILLILMVAVVLTLIWLIPGTPLPRVVESHALTNDGLPKYSLTTDGARLYFVRKVGGKPLLSEMSVQGGDVAEINVPFQNPVVYDVSPDRSALLVGGNVRERARELWVVPIPAGAPHRVGDFLVTGATSSPDGIHIAYVREHDLYLTRSDGSDQRSLSTMAGYLSTPRFSPTGNSIRFAMFDATENNLISIWETGVDGSQPRQVDLNASEQTIRSSTCCGVWSADAKFFFYTTFLTNQRMGRDIWVSRDLASVFDGSRKTERLTSGPLGFDSMALSPDGKKLFAVGTQARVELVRYDASSRSLQPFLAGISATDVEISRDGQWVTYVSYPELNLWRSRINGSERMQLTFAPTEAFKPRWSPDGLRIAFTDLRPLNRAHIFVVSRDGGVPTRILPGDSDNEIDPSWLPDGKSIVFARTYLDPELAIFEADIATGALRMLPGSKDLTGPVLSPDGRYVLALSRDWMSLMLYDRRTQRWQEVRRTDSGSIGYSNWSRDANWVYYRIGHGVARTRISDRRTEQVVDLNSIPEPNPSWIGLAQDNSILLDRDRSVREIYALTLSSSKSR